MTIIRPATATDRDTTVRVWEICGLTRPWNDAFADFDRALAHEASMILLADNGGRIVGTVMTGFDGHRGWIYYLGVVPDHQRCGIARMLLDAACDWLRQQDCPKVELMVREGNPAAGLYAHLGWERQDVSVFARRLA